MIVSNHWVIDLVLSNTVHRLSANGFSYFPNRFNPFSNDSNPAKVLSISMGRVFKNLRKGEKK